MTPRHEPILITTRKPDRSSQRPTTIALMPEIKKATANAPVTAPADQPRSVDMGMTMTEKL
jgi:hypothetical protein